MLLTCSISFTLFVLAVACLGRAYIRIKADKDVSLFYIIIGMIFALAFALSPLMMSMAMPQG